MTEKRNLKNHLSLSVAVCTSRTKVGVSIVVQANVKVTANGIDYCIEKIVNDSSALTEELKLTEDNSDLIEIHPELHCAS